MIECNGYSDRTQRAGSASVVFVYLDEIPEGQIVTNAVISATIFTTVHGDYTTAKYINIGIERNGVKFYLKGTDVGTGNTVISNSPVVVIPAGWRPFAEFEDTATSTTYEVNVVGRLYSSSMPTV